MNRLRGYASNAYAASFAEVDIASLVVFRIGLGLCLFALMTVLYDEQYVARLGSPGLHFTFPGFDWVRPLPNDGTFYEVYALRVLALGIALGFMYRICAALFFLFHTHLLLIDSLFYQNHLYLVCLICFLMIFVPAHKVFSLDVLLRPALYSPTVPAWSVWALRLQIALVFIFGGLAKLSYDWLHGEPMRALLEGTSVRVYDYREVAVYGLVYIGIVFDLFIPFLLFAKRTRLLAYDVSLVFNILNAQIWNIDVFPYFLMVSMLIFFAPDWPRTLVSRLSKRGARAPSTSLTQARAPNARRARVAGLLTIYFIAQLYLPLRHYIIPGNVLWTDEGRHFAWRMLMVRKRALATFHAYDPRSGERWLVSPTELGLPIYGASNPWTRPHNALLFARYVSDKYAASGRPDVEVRAEIYCSLHRRRPQLLIDPEVNLAAQRDRIWQAPWIVPLREPLPLTASERANAREAWTEIGGDLRDW